MKRGMLFILSLIFCMNLIFANTCDLDISLLNQDPYPAIPGETVKVVFQIKGISSSDCGDIHLDVLENFPFKLDQSSETSYTIKSGTFTKDYQSYFMAPFTLKIDKEANEGLNNLKLRYQTKASSSSSFIVKDFDIDVKDVRADFDVFVRDYDLQTNKIVFEVLNIANSDIKAVMVEIPSQDGLSIIGANKQNIGDIYSKEDTVANLNLKTTNNYIDLIIHYSDLTDTRRSVEKRVEFNKENFMTEPEKNNNSLWITLIILVIIGIIFYSYHKKKKQKLKELHS